MLRILLITAGFLIVTVALLLLQPSQPPARFANEAPAIDQQVSRAETDLVQVDSAALNPVVPALPAAQQKTSLISSTASVLSNLNGTASQTTTSADENLRSMTAGVLAGLNALRAAPEPANPSDALQNLIVRALQQGQSDTYIDALVNEAAAAGDVAVPGALLTNEGQVDTRTLLASIVEKATGETVAPAPSTIVGGDGVEVRVVQTVSGTVQYRFYTVQRGDSLGGISVKFYGDAQHYPRIYDANKQFLSSADKIRVGQRLSIPII